MLVWAISLFLILSGAAALIYQVVWVRLLSLGIGSTSASISIVLAAFFLGMGLGSWFAGRMLKERRGALKAYLFAETGIALGGLALLPLLLNLDRLISMLPIVQTGIMFKFSIVMALLLVPTFLIGVTFPLLMAVAIERKEEIGRGLAHFYSFNTLGALAGALLAGFVLIPRFGLDGAVYAAVSLNLLIVFMGFLLRNGPVLKEAPQHDSGGLHAAFDNRALAVLFFTGFAAIATEVGWMKYLIIYTMNTIYGFSFILAIFLAGIALGSLAAKHRLIAQRDPKKTLFAGLILLCAALIFARAGLGVFPGIYEQMSEWQLHGSMLRWSRYLVMFLILLPAAFLFGALFPVSLRLYSQDIKRLHEHVGRAYAVNIIAGILGSLAAGFWLIPYFGSDFLLSTMAFVILAASLLFINDIRRKAARMGYICLIALSFPLSIYMPHLDYSSMVEVVMRRTNTHIKKEDRLIFHYLKEGKAGVIGMHSHENTPCIARLSNNGMSESWIDVCKEENMLLGEFLLGEIPYLLNSSAKSAFVLGYGGGTTLRALSFNELERIDLVELEPAVLDASRGLFKGKLPTDDDKRVRIDFDDARQRLLMSERKYDIIVSQPSHPWLNGGANIMSRDFFNIAKSSLAPGGIYGQWVPLFKIDVSTLRSVIKAYTESFEYAVSFAFYSTGDFLLFGSDSPILLVDEKIDGILKNPKISAVLNVHGIKESGDLMRYFALTKEQLISAAGSVEPVSDTNLITEVFLSRYDENDKENSFNTTTFLQKIKER